MRARGCLVKIRPMDVHGLVHIRDNSFIIGRDDRCSYTIHDAAISRRHANIELVESNYVITDLNSTNGTFVNEQRITSHPLRAGDRVRLANHIFKFLSSDHIEAQYHETMYSMMTKDALTGAYNQRYFTDMLEREIERARRYQRSLALILFDIDHFKDVNDQHGHLVGDEVLQELSRRVEKVIRRDEIFARYGGEEFAMVMAETSEEGAILMAERLREVVGDTPFETGDVALSITISVGVDTRLPDASTTREMLIAAADAKLYEAKQAGRNRVCS